MCVHADACVSMRDGVCACAYVCMNVSTYVYALGLYTLGLFTIVIVDH